jgi:DNA-binding response OmpR family regulator
MSAQVMALPADNAMALAAYLAKPFMEEILCAAIEAALTNGYEGLWTTVEAAKHQSPSP